MNMNELAHMVDVARFYASQDGYPAIKICRGPSRGCGFQEPAECDNCYLLDARDVRTSAEILQAMERGNA
jgi:hypothetical protein